MAIKKHKPEKTPLKNRQVYKCDNCNTPNGECKLFHNSKGTFAYCPECVKLIYPDYKPVILFTDKKLSAFYSSDV